MDFSHTYLPTYVIGIWFLQLKILLGAVQQTEWKWSVQTFGEMFSGLLALRTCLFCCRWQDKKLKQDWPASVCYIIGSPICWNIKIQKWNWDLWTGNCINYDYLCQSIKDINIYHKAQGNDRTRLDPAKYFGGPGLDPSGSRPVP